MTNNQNSTLYHGNCLSIMPILQDKSVDMVLCDLPYGTSACSWDTVIPFEKMWEQYKRIIKDDGAIVLFGQEPFSSKLRMSNIEMYKYDWIWLKDNAANFLCKKYQPGKITENISVFGKMATSYSPKGNMKYFPILEKGKPYKSTNKGVERILNAVIRSKIHRVETNNLGTRLPNNILQFNRDKSKVHPTQKPVALLEYLIKTYTREGDVVFDNCMGSGSTGVACKNTNRRFVGIELDDNYFNMAESRIYSMNDKSDIA